MLRTENSFFRVSSEASQREIVYYSPLFLDKLTFVRSNLSELGNPSLQSEHAFP